MEEVKSDICDSGEDVQRHLYVIEMRVPAMYWSGIVLYLGNLLGYSEWAMAALNLSDRLVANFKAKAQKEQVVVLPMTERQKDELLKFASRELPGAISIFTLDGYYKARLGKGFKEVYAELYDEEEEE